MSEKLHYNPKSDEDMERFNRDLDSGYIKTCPDCLGCGESYPQFEEFVPCSKCCGEGVVLVEPID